MKKIRRPELFELLKKKRERHEYVIMTRRIIGMIVFVYCVFDGVMDWETASQSFTNAFSAALFIVLSFLPSFLRSEFKLHLPAVLQAIIVLFIFAAQILGEINNFYGRYFWWDDMLHTCSGLIIGYIGFLIIFTLNNEPRVRLKMNIFGVSAFAFCFAVACGAVWEIFEWCGDLLLGMNMQKGIYVEDINELEKYINDWGRYMDPALIDTMQDLVVDAIGALTAAIVGYFSISRRMMSDQELAEQIAVADREIADSLKLDA